MPASNPQDDETISYHTIDEQQASRLKDGQPAEDELDALERKIKALGNGTRLRILTYLSQQDLCVHDLSTLLDISQSAVSHQLKELRDRNVLTRRKEGRVVYYSLNDESLDEVHKQLRAVITD